MPENQVGTPCLIPKGAKNIDAAKNDWKLDTAGKALGGKKPEQIELELSRCQSAHPGLVNGFIQTIKLGIADFRDRHCHSN